MKHLLGHGGWEYENCPSGVQLTKDGTFVLFLDLGNIRQMVDEGRDEWASWLVDDLRELLKS